MTFLQEFIAPQNRYFQHFPTRRGLGRDEFAQRDLRQGRTRGKKWTSATNHWDLMQFDKEP